KVYNAGELAFIFLLKKPITTRLWRDYQLSSFSLVIDFLKGSPYQLKRFILTNISPFSYKY
ncbi:MAG: hypothetical protein E7B52_05770, partial [Limosilactobacillus fermentum]|nr:hypothetical protein [Limosilactobacillus fermentum]